MWSHKDRDEMVGDHMSNSKYFAKENKLQPHQGANHFKHNGKSQK